ncbi:hypothetical protein CgunFtcFv8_002650 [Champsocephalus gunnari]|uniref:Uncharacterized protein n=1 Tax=Champsocephalus gunnari TaxID=52237 RepID=A0AAN8DBP2_CHAGU|nr:hypothetical protein CgunFtcFv8_002650 [Champsocephalus gunnari]
MVSTNMTNNRTANCFVRSSSGFVREALNTVGLSSFTSGSLSHALQNIALTILLPDWFRMLTFIRKLRNKAEADKYYKRVCKDTLVEKED